MKDKFLKNNLYEFEQLHHKDEIIGEHYKKDRAVEVLSRAIIDKYREFGFKLGDTTFINVDANGHMSIISRPILPFETIMTLEKNGLIEIKNIIYDHDPGEGEEPIPMPDDVGVFLRISATRKLFSKFPAEKQTTKNKRKSLFDLPKGAKWEDIEIKFKSKYDVEILVKKESEGMFSNDNLGFYKTKTKDKKPDKQWGFLQRLSTCTPNQSEATIEYFSKALDTSKNNCFKIKEKLSKKLQEIFDLSNDPIYNYKDRGFYLPRFILRPEKLLRGSGEVWKQASGFNEEIGVPKDEENIPNYLDEYLN